MTPYRDCDQDSGVRAYEIGEAHMDVEFKDGHVYRYSDLTPGRAELDRMTQLARSGEGLNGYISRVVRKRYERKLR